MKMIKFKLVSHVKIVLVARKKFKKAILPRNN